MVSKINFLVVILEVSMLLFMKIYYRTLVINANLLEILFLFVKVIQNLFKNSKEAKIMEVSALLFGGHVQTGIAID